MKIKERINFVSNGFNNYNFKIVFLILIGLNLYGAIDIAVNTGFIYGIFCVYTNPWIISIIMFAVFMNTINHCKLYKNNYSVILRHTNKTNYLKNIAINVTISNSIVILTSILLTCCILLIKYLGDFSSDLTINAVPITYYIPYLLLRLIIIINTLSIIVVSVYYRFQECFALLTSIFMSIIILCFNYSFIPKDTFNLFYGSYLITPFFINVTNDICYSLLQILFLMLISFFFFSTALKKVKDL